MNELNIDRFTKAMSDILSRKYNAKVTITAAPRSELKKGGLKNDKEGRNHSGAA